MKFIGSVVMIGLFAFTPAALVADSLVICINGNCASGANQQGWHNFSQFNTVPDHDKTTSSIWREESWDDPAKHARNSRELAGCLAGSSHSVQECANLYSDW